MGGVGICAAGFFALFTFCLRTVCDSKKQKIEKFEGKIEQNSLGGGGGGGGGGLNGDICSLGNFVVL